MNTTHDKFGNLIVSTSLLSLVFFGAVLLLFAGFFGLLGWHLMNLEGGVKFLSVLCFGAVGFFFYLLNIIAGYREKYVFYKGTNSLEVTKKVKKIRTQAVYKYIYADWYSRVPPKGRRVYSAIIFLEDGKTTVRIGDFFMKSSMEEVLNYAIECLTVTVGYKPLDIEINREPSDLGSRIAAIFSAVVKAAI